MSARHVAIIQQYLAHYRVPFVNRLDELCQDADIDLRYYYGTDRSRHLLDEVPTCCVPQKVRKLGSLTFQPLLAETAGADLVIVEQATKHLVNYPLLARRMFTRQKLAFWGHGRNFQARNPNSISERIKFSMSKHVDWWFAYNDLSASAVRDLGFPPDRITTVQNTVDTRGLREALASLPLSARAETKAALGITSDTVAVFTGGLYTDKRLPFLIDACRLVHASLPDFHLIIIGGGPDEVLVRSAASQHDWIHYVGPKNDMQKIPYWAISKVFLMPGLVGLAIMDSFALQVPMVTTDYPYHSPEIGYLNNGVNGIMVEGFQHPSPYAKVVAELLLDGPLRQRIIDAGNMDAQFYTIENMAKNFLSGILKALD